MKKNFKFTKLFTIALFLFLVILFIFPQQLFSQDLQNIQAFVTCFYQQCLQRDPDQSGLDEWVDALLSGRITGADVAYGFVFSTEFIQREVLSEDYVTIMYRAFFDREPDSSGYSGWLDYLGTGKSRLWVLAGFVNSQEFKDLCSAYGINPGSLENYFKSVVVIGDSQVTDPRTWPEYLTNLIKQNYVCYDFSLYKSGVGGETIPSGYGRVEDLFGYEPSIFIINYGTNDANGPREGTFRTSPSDFAGYLSSMIDKIRKETGAIVAIMSTGPSINRETSHPMYNLSVINYQAQQVCSRKNAIFVDVFITMKNQENYSRYLDSDGLHYNEAGCQFVAELAYDMISRYFR